MLLIQNAHMKTMAGADIPNGCLLVENGKIAAVAPVIDAPAGAKVIDAQGRLLTPGCVEAHCHIGLDNQAMRWEGMDYNEIVDRLHRPRQRKCRRRHIRHYQAGGQAR